MRTELRIIRTVENIDDARLRPSLRGRARTSPLRACTICGRPSSSSRCDQHRDNRTTAERGYDHTHQQTRAALEPLVATGTVACCRCHQLILPGQPWDLDHNDTRDGYRGPAHRRCNRGKYDGGVTETPGAAHDSSDVSARKTGFQAI